MSVKSKLAFKYPYIAWKIFRTKAIGRKIGKLGTDDNRYPEQWRNDYIVKFLAKMTKAINVEVEVIGWGELPKPPAILAPNHASLWDPALIVLALRDARPGSDYKNIQSVFIAKESIKGNKKAKGIATIFSTFYINRKKPREALKTMDEFAAYAKKHSKMAIIFPEGTRSKDGRINEFKGGAFRTAKKAFMPIVPVTINNSYSISNLTRKEVLKVQVIFGKTIKPLAIISSDNKSIAARVQKDVVKNWVRPEGIRNEKDADLGGS